MADELVEQFSLNEDWAPEYDLTRRNTATRVKEPATGLANINAWLSLTEDGAAITNTSTAMTEAASKPGTYVGLVEQAALATALAGLVGTTIYKVLDKSGDFRVSTPVKVVAVRTV